MVTMAYTPEQNGKVEKENRTLVEAAGTMIYEKRLENKGYLWSIVNFQRD